MLQDSTEKNKFRKSIFYPFLFTGLIWIVHLIATLTGMNIISLGILPGKIAGLPGIIFSPFIHGSFDHLISNSIPLLFMGAGIFYFYPSAASPFFISSWLISGAGTWLIGRESWHIGASGLIYACAAFLFFSGIFRRDKRAVVLALLVTFLYGGFIWGVLPVDKGISWEGHLSGAFAGIILSFIFRKRDPYKRYEWEDEDDDDDYDPRKLEISYKDLY